jgi:hypothetical protein
MIRGTHRWNKRHVRSSPVILVKATWSKRPQKYVTVCISINWLAVLQMVAGFYDYPPQLSGYMKAWIFFNKLYNQKTLQLEVSYLVDEKKWFSCLPFKLQCCMPSHIIFCLAELWTIMTALSACTALPYWRQYPPPLTICICTFANPFKGTAARCSFSWCELVSNLWNDTDNLLFCRTSQRQLLVCCAPRQTLFTSKVYCVQQ